MLLGLEDSFILGASHTGHKRAHRSRRGLPPHPSPPGREQSPIEHEHPHIDFDTVAHAAERIRSGGVVAFPTETVYGLGADALNPEAVARVFRLKGRPSTNPLIVHVSGPSMALGVVSQWTPQADALAREFWPGPLTLVLPRGDTVPEIVTAGSPGVAVRAPNHPLAIALLMSAGRPLVGPSANLSGRVSPTTASHVREAFDESDVMVLDGGACPVGIESTVLSIMEGPPRILRPGVIGPDAIAAVLGEPVLEGAKGDGPALSPGMLAVHYAPHTPATVADPDDVQDLLDDADEDADQCVVLSHRLAIEVGEPHELIRMPAGAAEYAGALYAALRAADDRAADRIIVDRPPTTSEDPAEAWVWRAIADRLRRACARG
jgi:L-threonylcarbamoyladenylate synthase